MIVPMAATPEIRIVNDPSALAETAAQEVLEVARAAVAARGRFTVALAGGSTPRGTYPRLAGAQGDLSHRGRRPRGGREHPAALHADVPDPQRRRLRDLPRVGRGEGQGREGRARRSLERTAGGDGEPGRRPPALDPRSRGGIAASFVTEGFLMDDSFADRRLAALRNQFGGHAVRR